jgi:spermidine synthase
VLVYHNLKRWRSQFDTPLAGPVLGGVVAVLLLFYLARQRAVPRMVFAAGFAASALEMVVLLGFQVLYGALYQQVGLVVTVFMGGLAGGALVATRRTQGETSGSINKVRLLALGIALVAATMPWVLPHLGALDLVLASPVPGQAAILGLTFLLAALVGAQFACASAAEPAEVSATASGLFSADLLGAALGALLVSAWLIPVLGVTTVCLLTAGLNVAACGTLARKLK